MRRTFSSALWALFVSHTLDAAIMLKTRGVQSICASCRLSIAISRARSARLPLKSQSAPLQLRSAAPRAATPRRSFSTTLARRNQDQEKQDDAAVPDGLPPSATEAVNYEVNARRARQQFGDTLPRHHLNGDEYAIYERLYGPPIFVDSVEELQELESVAEEEIIKEEQPDGSTVLLRRTKDGKLEEVEITGELHVPEEAGAEEAELDAETMTPEEWEARKDEQTKTYHDDIYEQSRLQHEEAEAWEDVEELGEEDDFVRAHPLTIAGRFKPSPSTVFLPKETLVDPTALLLTRANHKHLTESANRIFGGPGLPNSASTAPARLGNEQKPIPLDPSQSEMGNIEADAYMASVQPGTYASVMSAMVEVRRRLGTGWLEHMLQNKKGGTILDAGSGGVGVLAWHEMLEAEWQRMHENSGNTSHGATPLGKATVLTASDTLRHRASKLLDNTTFIPRLPETVTLHDEANTQQPRKFYDVIIAPHTLWTLRQDYLRKEQVEKYWSLLNPKGGVLILIEKGLPRGFEVIAAARSHLLDKHISSPGSEHVESTVDSQLSKPDEDARFTDKETGMIVAPCTNHSTCPMYQSTGVSLGRKDFCYFSQRYIRPPYLQRILNAKDKNHEDVQFSYLAVQRGRDQRLPQHDILGKGFVQGEASTAAAFEGHEWNAPSNADPDMETEEPTMTTTADVNPLTFPRLVLPALKRRGHITMDVCTPAGTLERWTVPRSFSKQAFRDARKARWGDLWALGAKTRIPRNVRLGRPTDEFDKKGRKVKKAKQVTIEIGIGEKDGRTVEEGPARILGKGGRMLVGDRDGRYTNDRKIRGSKGRKGRKKRPDQNYDALDDMSLSFYPQPLSNYARKSTLGLAIDFPTLNVLGFFCYTISTASFLYSPTIKLQYAARHPEAPTTTVRFNDFLFAAHGAVLGDRGHGDDAGHGGATRWAWIDVIYTLGYIKLLTVFLKYIPQAWVNYKRQSTQGWSIYPMLLDFAGGWLSLAQLCIDSALENDWSGVTGNPVKFGLGNITIIFDVVFMLQHYVLYRNSGRGKAEGEGDEEEREGLVGGVRD
ncbi:37s ribosomal protein rsm22 [Stemphylium lycopersici]|uniref:37s ribosomal protein rsm22 n=1 Tax=Stemphylium lycopersici TaxID=183478 RepID=A0A364N0E0_STELY|nr:37s ribosomal protein rsm22 [Stemphylium lycopersici]RAR08004.1 37s ribosomal protein rsm22 [Stemphylium lycopersici]